jgi:flagellar protein FliT
MNQDLQKLKTIIEDTDTLMKMAEEGEWDALIELEKKRSVKIDDLFKVKPDIHPEKLADGIQYILEKNRILKQYSLSQKDSIQMEISKANHAHKAVNAYLQTP